MTILEGFWKVEGLFCKAVGRPVEYTGSGQGEKEGQIQNSSPSMPKDLNVKRNHAGTAEGGVEEGEERKGKNTSFRI